jgi:predicted AlkP superfamily pyrophosphatase or phosphodiesterase
VETPLDPARLAQLSGTTDDQPGEVGDKGFGATFPHAMASTKDPADALFAMPIGNDLVLDTATAAIDAEHLGTRDIPDLLVVSLSAHDYIGHGWGQESWESWDMMLRLDQRLAQFLDDLDRRVGAGRWAMIATSDHGASPLPERSPRGGRLRFDTLKEAANRAAITELGAGDWVADAKYPSVYLTAAALAAPKRDRENAMKKIAYALRAFPGIARVVYTADFAGHCEQRTGDALVLCRTIDPERSGELLWLPARGWVHEDDGELVATAHGSMNDYDRLVPVIVLAPGRTKHAAASAPDSNRFDMTKVAGTLAGWLGVPAPNALPR